MKPFVTALVVSHDADEFFTETARAVANQSRRPDRVIVVDTSTSNEAIARTISANHGFDYVTLTEESSLQDSILAALSGSNQPDEWLWLLHDDSAPEPSALAELISAIETSPSVAIAGPKLLRWQNARTIGQLGLTLTPGLAPFSPVSEAFDQGQHDDVDDVMAISTAAALIRVDVFEELGGFDPAAPPLAADIDFSIRTRLAGHRVIVVPKSKVRHVALSLSGKRPRRWLGVSPNTAIRRAAIHLRFTYGRAIWLPIYWLFLPLIGLLRSVLQVSRKRPELIWSELSSAFWGFFTVIRRLSSRRRGSSTRKLQFRELRGLLATRAEVRAHQRADFEREEAIDNLQAFERGDVESLTGSVNRGFAATGGFWWMLALVGLSYKWWPTDIAVTAKGLIPLSSTWWGVFTHAGASYQPIGLGFFAPSDPFAWVLTVLSATTFWAPSLSIAILLLLVKPLAFIGAWKLTAQVSDTTWVRVLAGLGFALWPALEQAQLDGRLTAIISSLAMPWLIIALLRVAQLGRVTRSSAQSWTWVATAGLLTAIIGASTPSLIPVVILALALLALAKVRRFGYLIWVGVPLVAIFGPTILYYVIGLAHPLALLADPGLAQPSSSAPFLDLLPLIASAAVAIVAVFAVLRRRAGIALLGWALVLLLVLGAYLVSSLNFPAVGVGQANLETVNGSPTALLIVIGLILAVLVAIAVDGIPARAARRVIAGLSALLVVAPGLVLTVAASPQLSFSDGRVVPSIVAAEAAQGSTLKLLVLTPSSDATGHKRLAAELVAGDGVHLDDVSLAYRFSIAAIAKAKYAGVSQLIADLVSANGTPISSRLQEGQIGYVLVPKDAPAGASDLSLALNSVSELEPVGLTDFGRLWRVRAAKSEPVSAKTSPWSITKGAQVAVLLGFALMAIPSRRSRRRASQEIFIESGEDAQ